MTPEPLDIFADRISRVQCPGCRATVDVSAQAPFSEVPCPECGRHLEVPVRFGSFLLLGLLGRGGMGAVYRALDRSLHRMVAVKVMRRQFGEDRQFVAGFLREARATAALSHAHVVMVHAFGEEKGQPYMVMELVDGGRFDRRIKEQGTIQEAEALAVAAQVAEGLLAANEAGLIHEDVKPANILFDAKETAKIVDFGLARFVTAEHRGGEIWGTPYYVAPEKAKAGPVDHRADIYSLGATLFHAVCGRAPFVGESAREVVLARLDRPAPGVREFNEEITARTARIIARMLETSPNRRYPTYASLLADLYEAETACREGRPDLVTAVERDRPRRRYLMWVALGALGMVCLAVALIMSPNETGPTARPPGPPAASGDARREPPPGEDTEASAAGQVLREAVDKAAAGQRFAAAQLLGQQAARISDGDPLRQWLPVVQAVTVWIDHQDAGVEAYLAELDSPEIESASLAPAVAVARCMKGDLTPEKLALHAVDWGEDDRAAALFVLGLHALRDGAHDQAFIRFDAYAAAAGGRGGWPAGFQSLVDDWKAQWARWQKAQEELKGASSYASLRALEALRPEISPLLRPPLDAALQQVRALRAQEAAGRAEARRKKQETQVASEQQRVAQAEVGTRELVRRRAYDEALSVLSAVEETLTTEEGKQALLGIQDTCRRLLALRTFIAEQLEAAPPPGQIAELGGSAAGADASGIRVAARNSVRTHPWGQVSPRLYLKLLDYYIERAALPSSAKAELLLNTAVFCGGGEAEALAGGYARRAIGLAPELEAKAGALMPGLGLDGSGTVP